jgi:lipoate---protein ligase
MFCLNLKSYDPFFNLAVEEILLKNSEEEYLILGVNDPCVVIGKHQSGHREVNTEFVNEHHIPVIRRISGGGTVFHDRGNLNFSFIRHSESGKQVDFRKYTKPVIDFLASLGVDARFEGKNDLRVDGYKVSGNAEHIFHNRVLHHGTLLFRCSLDTLRNSIRKDTSKYTSRAVPSNPSSVMNLYERMNCIEDISEFKRLMINYFLKSNTGFVLYDLTQEVIQQAESLAESKYKTWEWNWAYGPEYQFSNNFEIDGIIHSCRMLIKEGIITECELDGSEKVRSLSGKLKGCRHMAEDIFDLYRKENINLALEEVYNFF